jgi:ribonucleoside-diphosphate reductase subunit M1
MSIEELDMTTHLHSDENNIVTLHYEKILDFINMLCMRLDVLHLNTKKITDSVYSKLKEKNTINDIEEQIISVTSNFVTEHYDYPKLAVWILIKRLHKNTSSDFLETTELLYNNVNKFGKHIPIISKSYYEYVKEHYDEINKNINYEKDYDFSLFGFRTLEK